MKVLAIIPARMAATRFPGKPLADILGLPTVEHVRRRVALSREIARVIVATCDREIFDAVKSFGGEAVMTADTYDRCTDRIAEAACALDADIVVNVQGDEPLVNPRMFGPLLKPLKDNQGLVCTNLMAEIESDSDFNSPNTVKVVCDLEGNALYFSREPVPSMRKTVNQFYPRYKQLGVIAFRRDFLFIYASLPQAPLEKVESVDMLRAVENGYKVRMVNTTFSSIGVDTPEDLERARKMMENDPLFNIYRLQR